MNNLAFHKFSEQLRPSATWKNATNEAYVREQIERGLERTQQGKFAADTDVAAIFTRWGVQTKG